MRLLSSFNATQDEKKIPNNNFPHSRGEYTSHFHWHLDQILPEVFSQTVHLTTKRNSPVMTMGSATRIQTGLTLPN